MDETQRGPEGAAAERAAKYEAEHGVKPGEPQATPSEDAPQTSSPESGGTPSTEGGEADEGESSTSPTVEDFTTALPEASDESGDADPESVDADAALLALTGGELG